MEVKKIILSSVVLSSFLCAQSNLVLEYGVRVQHHAMEQDKTYMVNFGKKFKNFDLIAKYSYQNGIELPANQEDVDTKVVSLNFTYKF